MRQLKLIIAALFLISPFAANAVIITFDEAITGAITFAFDADGDTIDDVIFTTTDPLGFNTVGPGPNQLYIDEPGLEGTTLLGSDLRVDFLIGAEGTLGFGFAMSLQTGLVDGVTFSVYDGLDVLLGTTSVLSDFTVLGGGGSSLFPEGLASLSFSGVAAYATFDFSNVVANRYIIDNFQGTFGSTEVSVPEPGTLALLAIGLFGMGLSRRKKA